MTEPKPFASLSSGLLARKGTAKPAMRPQGFGKYGAGLDDLGWNDMGHPEPQAPSPFEAPHEEHVPSPISALTPMTSGFEEEEEFEPAPPIVEQQRAAIEASFAEPAEGRSEERLVLATKVRKEPESDSVLDLETVHADPEPEEVLELEQEQEIEPEPEIVAEQAEPEPEYEPEPAYEPEPQAYQPESQPAYEPEPFHMPEPVREAPVAAAPAVAESRQAERNARSKAAFTLRLDGDRHLKLRLACAVSGRSAQQLVTEALDQLLHSRPEVGALADQLPSKTGKLN